MTQLQEIVVVGGGTAGWMSAIFLDAALRNRVNITVVESPKIGTIGVGEATVPSLKSFFDFVGLREQDWMPKCDATYKLAIKFVGWGPGRGHFYHPFEHCPKVEGFALSDWWLKTRRELDRYSPYWESSGSKSSPNEIVA